MKNKSDHHNLPTLILVLVVGTILVGGLFWWSKSKTAPPEETSTPELIPTQPASIGIILRSSGDEVLPALQTIDQADYVRVIQSAWQEALSKAPQSAIKFPNDANLLALQVASTASSDPKSLVVYANRPVIIETTPVQNLPNNQAYALELDRENYQLLIRFLHTPQVVAVDVPQVLTEAFNQIINQRRLPQEVESNPYKILAFEVLL